MIVDCPKTVFGDLEVGETFVYNSDCYIKMERTNLTDLNAFCFNVSKAYRFTPDTVVIKIPMKVVPV